MKHESQADILTVPARRPIKPVYVVEERPIVLRPTAPVPFLKLAA